MIVVERRPLEVKTDLRVDRTRRGYPAKALKRSATLVHGCRHEASKIERSRFELREDRVPIRDDPIHDSIEQRAATKIVRTGDEFHRFVAFPTDEFEGSKADREIVIRRVIDIRKRTENVLRQNRERVARKEAIGERCVRALEPKDDGSIAARADICYRGELARKRNDVCGVQRRVGGEDDVVCGDRRAVVPSYAAAQAERDRAPVARDAAVRKRGNLLCEFGVWPVLRVVPHQITHCQVRERRDRELRNQVEVQTRDPFAIRVSKRSGDRKAVAVPERARPRRDVDARARSERGASQQECATGCPADNHEPHLAPTRRRVLLGPMVHVLRTGVPRSQSIVYGKASLSARSTAAVKNSRLASSGNV